MKALFKETSSLDRRCYEKFGLSEDILMEHAADGMADFISQKFEESSSVLIVCGAGNNGADGIALARLLHLDYRVKVYLPFGVKSEMANLQKRRAELVGVSFTDTINECDIVVDALFGSGLSRDFSDEVRAIIKKMNTLSSYKIACDLPSGIQDEGTPQEETFRADITLCMGALKVNMFLDESKDYIGKFVVINLGLSAKIYELETDYKLLEKSDLLLPSREKLNTHKGNFGHLSLLCGEKIGASVIAARAALNFGVGLVTIISNEKITTPYELMLSHTLPSNTTALAVGMGLGIEYSRTELEKLIENNLPLVLDADIFYHELILELLTRKNIVITPHPKEFVELLRVTKIADISVAELQKKRFKYVELFHKSLPHITLLLKGANVIIANEGSFYINPLGDARLAKGGSGDVLSGLIAALLAQGYDLKSATLNASLAHTLALESCEKNSYAITPYDIIEGVSRL